MCPPAPRASLASQAYHVIPVGKRKAVSGDLWWRGSDYRPCFGAPPWHVTTCMQMCWATARPALGAALCTCILRGDG